MALSVTFRVTILLTTTSPQIIEEQLAFPSGTATGQLISVLHDMPPPDTTLRHRTAYNALATEEDEETIPFVADPTSLTPTPTPRETDALHAPETPEVEAVEEKEGWSALTWSFAASGVMTVSPSLPPAYFLPFGTNVNQNASSLRTSSRSCSRSRSSGHTSPLNGPGGSRPVSRT